MLFNGWPLSLSPLRSCMDASVDKCFPFLSFAGWCAVRIKAHASQGKRWQKSWPTKSWGGGRRRICPGRLAAFLPFPFSGDSLLNGPLLPFFVFWFKLLLPALFSLLGPFARTFLVVVVVITANSPPSPTRPMASQWSDWTIFFFFFFLLFLLNRWLSTTVYQKNRKHN